MFSLNVLVDLIFALFPLELIRHLQIQRKVKLAIYLLLSCGVLTAVCSIGRVVASNLTEVDVTCKSMRAAEGVDNSNQPFRGVSTTHILGNLRNIWSAHPSELAGYASALLPNRDCQKSSLLCPK